MPSKPGNFTRGSHRSGRKPLDLSGSCNRAKTAVFHRTNGSSRRTGWSKSSPSLGRRAQWRRDQQTGGGPGNELVHVDIRCDGIVILVDQQRRGAMHEGPQSQCNLLRVSTHLVAVAVEGNLADELGKAGVS